MPDDTPKKRAAETTADRLRDGILRGDLAAGTDLPGERELSGQLGVSRLTLRSALARLEGEGLVQPVHGSGTRILDYRETGGVDLLGYLAALAIEGGDIPLGLLRDMLELRRMVAVEAVHLISTRAEPDYVRLLRAQLQRLESTLGDPEQFMEEDLRFARLMVRGTDNMALELLFNTIVRVLERQPNIEPAFVVNSQGTTEAYAHILDLIEKREPERARRTTRRLLERLDRDTVERLTTVQNMLKGAANDGV